MLALSWRSRLTRSAFAKYLAGERGSLSAGLRPLLCMIPLLPDLEPLGAPCLAAHMMPLTPTVGRLPARLPALHLQATPSTPLPSWRACRMWTSASRETSVGGWCSSAATPPAGRLVLLSCCCCDCLHLPSFSGLPAYFQTGNPDAWPALHTFICLCRAAVRRPGRPDPHPGQAGGGHHLVLVAAVAPVGAARHAHPVPLHSIGLGLPQVRVQGGSTPAVVSVFVGQWEEGLDDLQVVVQPAANVFLHS